MEKTLVPKSRGPVHSAFPLRNKIIVAVALYLLIIGIAVSVFLYAFLYKSVSAKAERLDRMNLAAVQTRLDRDFDALFSLAVLCANDPLVIRAVSGREMPPQERRREALDIQEKLNAFMQSNIAGTWINTIILSGPEDFFVVVSGRRTGAPDDRERLFALPLYSGFENAAGQWVTGFGPTMTWGRQGDTYGIIVPVPGTGETFSNGGFVYLEAGLEMIATIFRGFPLLPGISAAVDGRLLNPEGILISAEDFPVPSAIIQDGLRFKREGRSFRLDIQPLEKTGMKLYNEVDITELGRDDREISFTVIMVVLASLLAAAGLAVVLSFVLTKPIKLLISRIKKIGDNDLSFDPEIEKSRDEIGQIGRSLNEMSGSIERLLSEMEENYRQQRNAELALLQLRINPHFLYNTLNSIQWMAKIQKNTAIVGMTGSLINLLRNIGSSPQDMITLEEELSLLDDYVAVMSIRFMGIFSMENRIDRSLYSCLIPKLTIQPLVENSIIHGIAPSGIFGTIVLEGRLEDSSLVLTVEDSGLGISKEKIGGIFRSAGNKNGTSLNNIGLKNVDERLKLIYGGGMGLSLESEEGKFTRVTIRIAAQTELQSEAEIALKEKEDAPCTAGG